MQVFTPAAIASAEPAAGRGKNRKDAADSGVVAVVETEPARKQKKTRRAKKGRATAAAAGVTSDPEAAASGAGVGVGRPAAAVLTGSSVAQLLQSDMGAAVTHDVGAGQWLGSLHVNLRCMPECNAVLFRPVLCPRKCQSATRDVIAVSGAGGCSAWDEPAEDAKEPSTGNGAAYPHADAARAEQHCLAEAVTGRGKLARKAKSAKRKESADASHAGKVGKKQKLKRHNSGRD